MGPPSRFLVFAAAMLWIAATVNAQTTTRTVLQYKRDVDTCDQQQDVPFAKGLNSVAYASSSQTPADHDSVSIHATRALAQVDFFAPYEDVIGDLPSNCSTYHKPSSRDYDNPVFSTNFDANIYDHSTYLDTNNRVRLHWSYHPPRGDDPVEGGGVMWLALEIDAEGWVGFGPAPNNAMAGGDYMIAWASQGEAFAKDRKSVAYNPVIDTSQDAFDIAVSQFEANTPTQIPFPTGTFDDSNRTIQWSHWSNDERTTRFVSDSPINSGNVHRLTTKWTTPTLGNSGTGNPVVAGNRVYFTEITGYVRCVSRDNGFHIFSIDLEDYVDDDIKASMLQHASNATAKAVTDIYSRSSPMLDGDMMVVLSHFPTIAFAFDRFSGELLWKTGVLDAHEAALFTGSGVIHDGALYVGTASFEEVLTIGNPSFRTSFSGKFMRLDLMTGAVKWVKDMTPVDKGYVGVGLWQSAPSVWPARNLIFLATGNNYDVPDHVYECMEDFDKPWMECVDDDVYGDSMLALDMSTGEVVWHKALHGVDSFTSACAYGWWMPGCHQGRLAGEDWDFGSNPSLIFPDADALQAHADFPPAVVVACSKAAACFCLDALSGEIVWTSHWGVGDAVGGTNFGVAVDDKHIYAHHSNWLNSNPSELLPYDQWQGQLHSGSYWVAVDLYTGDVRWSFVNPCHADGEDCSIEAGVGLQDTSQIFAATTVVNDVVFASSNDRRGHLFALHADTGELLWQMEGGAALGAGSLAVVDGDVFFGTGYTMAHSTGNDGNTFWALELAE